MRVIFYKNRTKAHESLCGKPGFGQKPPFGQSGPLHPTASPHTRPCFAKVGPRHDETPFQFYEAPFRKFETAPRILGLQEKRPNKSEKYKSWYFCFFILSDHEIMHFYITRPDNQRFLTEHLNKKNPSPKAQSPPATDELQAASKAAISYAELSRR